MKITQEAVRNFATTQVQRLLPNGFGGKFFLAGGCYKSLIHGKAPNDLDLWPASLEDRVSLIESLVSQGSVVVTDGPFNTVLKNSVYPIRVEVTRKCPPSAKESVADFDIQLACVSAEYSNRTIRDVYIHPGIPDCIKFQKVVAVSRLTPMRYTLLSLQRLERYGKELGYRVCEQSIRQVWDIYTAASKEERKDLLKGAGLQSHDVPPWADIQRVFIDGRPSEPCRPFTHHELDSLRSSLLFNKNRIDPSNRSPAAIFVIGLPGAGKGTVLKEILAELGFSLEEMVDLDMDRIRSYHGQFTHYLGETVIHKDLIAWVKEGSQAEHALFRDEHSIVGDVLTLGYDFVLPISDMNSLHFIHYVSRRKGYVPHVIEIRVPLSVAMTRTVVRAHTTGRYTPLEYLQAQEKSLKTLLPAVQKAVQSYGGMAISYDNSRSGGGGRGAPDRIF